MKFNSSDEFLTDLANTRMPFGKYAGRFLIELPEAYVLWFKQKGYPSGKLGEMMQLLEEIKANGLEELVRRLQKDVPREGV
jgi:uncharacterized protein